MKKFHVYNVYTDDGDHVYKFTVPAESQKAAEAYVSGNGEIVKTKLADLQDIDTGCLADTLRRSGWGQAEIDVITRALTMVGLDR